MAVRVRASLACKIAKIDRYRFNEAVAAGNYKCAPKTAKGATRIFEEDDLVALFIFARLQNFGLEQRRAGELACQMSYAIRHDPDKPMVFQACAASGNEWVFAGSSASLARLEATDLFDAPLTHVMHFDITNIRKILADAIEKERNILGEDEA